MAWSLSSEKLFYDALSSLDTERGLGTFFQADDDEVAAKILFADLSLLLNYALYVCVQHKFAVKRTGGPSERLARLLSLHGGRIVSEPSQRILCPPKTKGRLSVPSCSEPNQDVQDE